MASTKFSIDDKALPQTPANEWADETTAALNTESPLDSIRPPFESIDSTPRMPGGYGKAKPSEQPPIAETAANAATSVTTAATGLLASAKQYIPQSVASYFPGAPAAETSLPSQETDGHLTSSDGVGSLPGGARENSVAKLPEERAIQDSIPSSSGLSTGGVGDLPGNTKESGVVKLPAERAFEKGTAVTTTGGVGNLPGCPGETDVARLPEERAVESSFYTGASDPRTSFLTPATNPSTVRSDTDSSSAFSTRAADGSVAATPTREMSIPLSTSIAKSPLNQSTTVAFQDSIKTPQSETQPQSRHSQSSFEKKSGRKETNLVSEPLSTSPPQANTEGRLYPLGGNPAVYSNSDNTPAPPLPITSSTAEIGHGESKFVECDSPKMNSAQHIRSSISPAGSPSKSSFSASSKHTDSGNGSNGSLGRKTKFMDKVKGEVKVISGKLGHNEAKVEEGKRMMGK